MQESNTKESVRNEIKNRRAGTGKQKQECSSRTQKLESKKINIDSRVAGHHDIRISGKQDSRT